MGDGTTLILGHRGASGRLPENTLAALVGALDDGADGVELDVRLAPDGRLVLSHDPLDTAADQGLCELAAALDGCLGALVNVEIKHLPTEPDAALADACTDAVLSLFDERGARDRVIVSSFHLDTVDRVRAAAPHVPTGWLTFGGAAPLDLAAKAADHGHVHWHPHHLALDAEVVAAASSMGVSVNTWTVDDLARIADLAGWGVAAVITNEPAAAVAAVAKRR